MRPEDLVALDFEFNNIVVASLLPAYARQKSLPTQDRCRVGQQQNLIAAAHLGCSRQVLARMLGHTQQGENTVVRVKHRQAISECVELPVVPVNSLTNSASVFIRMPARLLEGSNARLSNRPRTRHISKPATRPILRSRALGRLRVCLCTRACVAGVGES